jgi:hypothetical protein
MQSLAAFSTSYSRLVRHTFLTTNMLTCSAHIIFFSYNKSKYVVRCQRSQTICTGAFIRLWRRRIRIPPAVAYCRRHGEKVLARYSFIFGADGGPPPAATGPPRSRCRRPQHPRALAWNRHHRPHLAAPAPPCIPR